MCWDDRSILSSIIDNLGQIYPWEGGFLALAPGKVGREPGTACVSLRTPRDKPVCKGDDSHPAPAT